MVANQHACLSHTHPPVSVEVHSAYIHRHSLNKYAHVCDCIHTKVCILHVHIVINTSCLRALAF